MANLLEVVKLAASIIRDNDEGIIYLVVTAIIIWRANG